MADRVITNAAQMKVFWANGTRSWINVVGILGAPGLPLQITQANVDAMFTALKANSLTTTFMGLCPTTTSLTKISVRDLRSANFNELTSTGTALAGTGTGDVLPLNLACCITLRTQLAGKSFRGRVYVSGMNELQNDATGRIVPAAATAAQGLVAAYSQCMSVITGGTAVLSFARDAKTIPAKTIAAKSGFANAVTATESRNLKWESQRRRTGRT